MNVLSTLDRLAGSVFARGNDSMMEEAFSARAAMQAVLEAAAPFERLLQAHHERERDETPLFAVNGELITFGQLRRLRAALTEAGVKIDG